MQIENQAPLEETPTTPVETSGDTSTQTQVEDLDIGDIGDDFDTTIFEQSLTEVVEPSPAGAPSEVTAQPGSQPPAVTTPATPPAQQVAPQPQVTPPVVQPQPTQQAPAQAVPPQGDPQQQQQVQQQPPQQQAPQQAQESAVDPFTQLEQTIQAGQAQVIDAVAQGVYALSEEEVEGVLSDPGKHLPQMMARVHVNAVQGVLRHVAQQMPAMVSGLLRAREENSQREESFFKAWPQLDRTKHMADIVKVGQVFRQLNPNATQEDFIKTVGAQVVLAHGLHLQQQQQQQAPPQQPVAPTVPVFQPAGVGHQGGTPAPAQVNIWEEFTEAMKED